EIQLFVGLVTALYGSRSKLKLKMKYYVSIIQLIDQSRKNSSATRFA
ncbi:hypothetical protein LEP1GSC150_4156, partial [Leptospira interrogans serovar Copenhageni str. LT2050]